jgi:hypothetical protein
MAQYIINVTKRSRIVSTHDGEVVVVRFFEWPGKPPAGKRNDERALDRVFEES